MEREQIIKALECCTKDDCDNCPNTFGNCYSNLAGYALTLIKELTQANEQLSESYDHLEKTKDELLEERSKLTYENERLRGKWISVEDRLPDNYRAVLVVCESTSISGGRLRAVGSYGGGFWSMADADGTMRLTKYMQYIVTHWMELPKIPKMKGE